MKPSKSLTKTQRQRLWGEYIHLNIKKNLGFTFEDFLIKIIPLEAHK